MATALYNSFANELASFKSLPAKDLSRVPTVGSHAPENDKLKIPKDKPVVLVFLRHVGCPFAEKTFRLLTHHANKNPSIHFIAISHTTSSATDAWLPTVGGQWEVSVLSDPERDIYALYGLGQTSYWHALSPGALNSVIKLGREEGIWNTPVGEGGSRWQVGGVFGMGTGGVVRYVRVMQRADDVPDFKEVLKALDAKEEEL